MPLTGAQRTWYLEQIEELDPSGSVVRVDRAANLLQYSTDIRSDESLTRTATDEELARGLSVAILVRRMGYAAERLYIEKHIPHGHPGSMSDEVDLLIYDEEDLPYALWEFKSAEEYGSHEDDYIRLQLFGTAPLTGAPHLLVYATVMPGAAAAQMTVKCIDRNIHVSYEAWDLAGRPHATAFPTGYADPAYRAFTNGGPLDLRTTASHADFRAAATALHQEFFGEHADNTVYVNLMKCLLAKIYDERQTPRGRPYDFQVRQTGGREEGADSVFRRVNDRYRIAYSRYIDTSGTPDEVNPREFAPERVKTVVRVLQSMALTRGAALHGDVIGAFFEEILRVGFKQDKGMYFTHANLVRFMCDAVDLDGLAVNTWTTATHPDNRLPYVIDPACGSGAFLLRAMTVVTNAIRGRADELVRDMEAEQFFRARLSDENPNYWAEAFVYGLDPKFVMAITAKINMVLHGDGSAHVFKNDALAPLATINDHKFRPAADARRTIPRARYAPDVSESFDVVLSNPPFGVTIATETKRTIPQSFTQPPNAPSEFLFLERWYQLLKPGGRLAVVVPEGLLNTTDATSARLFLYRTFAIRAIVSLPRNLFIETPTLTSLLFAQKKSSDAVRAWDDAWERAAAAWEARIAALKRTLRRMAREAGRSAEDVEELVLEALPGLIPWAAGRPLRSSGRPVGLDIPDNITAGSEAAAHYLKLIGSAGIRTLVRNAIFRQVVEDHDYEYPVYQVDEVGYKLSKRRERLRPNQLAKYIGQESGTEHPNLHLSTEDIVTEIDISNPSRVVDFIRRDVRWQ